MHVKYLIIGAGPTGLGAANRLAELGENDFLVLERHPYAGGLAAQHRQALRTFAVVSDRYFGSGGSQQVDFCRTDGLEKISRAWVYADGIRFTHGYQTV